MRTISAADANRQFSQLLREVREGRTIVVTSRGTPVATIAPADRAIAVQDQAKGVLLARLRSQQPANAASWTRDELYEGDEP